MSSVSSSRPTSPTPSEPLSIAPLRANTSSYRFAFNPRRGPASVVSDANESRADLSLTDLNGSSPDDFADFDLSEAANQQFAPSWSSSRYGFNAISTVLNNPKRLQAPLKSGKAPLPGPTSPELPRVRRKDFDAYLNAVEPVWGQFARHEAYSLSGDNVGSSVKGKAREIPPLSAVPSIYFDARFDLRNPRTFASVTEQDASTASGATPKHLNPEDISLNQILQEKLSHYMDIVEQHLTREVQSRSTSFFAALSNLQDLQTEGSDCLDRIKSLRDSLQEVDTTIAQKGLRSIKLQKRLLNIQTVERTTSAVKEVSDMLSMLDKLIADAHWDEALSILALLEEVASSSTKGQIPSRSSPDSPGVQVAPMFGLQSPNSESEAVPSISSLPPRRSTAGDPASPDPIVYSLSSLVSLSSLPDRIKTSRSRISASLRATAVEILKIDLIDRFDKKLPNDDAQARGLKLRSRLIPLWTGILRTDGVDVGNSLVTKKLGQNLPQNLDVEDDAETSHDLAGRAALLADELLKFSQTDFLSLTRTLYAGLISLLEGILDHIEVFNGATPTEVKISDPIRASNQQALETILPDTLPAATELANTRLSKILAIRVEQHVSLSLPDFLVFFNEGWSFVVKCEVMARKMIVGLRGVIGSQAKGFLLAFHNSRLASSATLVVNEQWAQVEVPSSAQRWSDLLVDSAMTDPREFVLWKPESGLVNGHSASGPTPSSSTSKQLLVDGRPFFVVGATLLVIEMLLDYMKIVVNLPLLTTDVMSRTIEYLKAFNSRTCQVVLGAGAMRSAGLKNITAKHLALASQSLSVMIALIPYVRENFRRHLNPKQAVMLVEFDKLKQDYHDHQNEIHSKLIAIMGDRLTLHCRTLNSIKWDEPATENPNGYMRVLIKETLSLHKILSKYLPIQAFVMFQVFAAINHRLSEEYVKIDLPSQEAKDRLLEDARYLQRELSALKDINMSNTMLETVVKEKTVRRPSPFVTRRSSAMVSSGDVALLPGSPRTPRSSLGTSTPVAAPSGAVPLPAASPAAASPSSQSPAQTAPTTSEGTISQDDPPAVPEKRKSSLGYREIAETSEAEPTSLDEDQGKPDEPPPPPLKETSPTVSAEPEGLLPTENPGSQ
ncbi:Vps54-domain-containing protein [Clavulina sp. PMI_390]|nr:Vps54-domain-containing protein [Clavulina sp. PMI_390]